MRRIITVSKSARHWFVFWLQGIHYHLTYGRIILILSSHKRACFPLWVCFWIQLCTHALLLARILHAPSHPTSFYHAIVGLFCDKYYEVSHDSVFLQPPVTTSILGPNFLLSILFSYTPPAFLYNPFCFYHWMGYIQSTMLHSLTHIQIKLCPHLFIPVLHYFLTHSFNYY
jgi:hypothetical protein